MNKQGEHGMAEKLISLDFPQLVHEAKGQIPQVYPQYEVPRFRACHPYRCVGIDNGETDYDEELVEKAIRLALEKVKA